MAAIITEKFRVHNAKQFKEDFGESASSTYLFIGRPWSWADDTSPPSPKNGVGEEFDSWSDMIAMKKISSGDVSHGIPRIDWDDTGSTSYDEYAHDYSSANLTPASGVDNLHNSSARPYVMTDEYHVYKCIRTGRDASGAVVNSTVKPTGTDASAIVTTSDAGAAQGYQWKYMYTISASETIKFVTNDFLPVKTIGAVSALGGVSNDGSAQWDVEDNAIDGGIYHVRVDNGGSGYTDGTHTGIAIDGDGSSGECTIYVSSGAISKVEVTTYGTGYRRASIDLAGASATIGAGSNGAVTPIISPLYGHGANPVEELGGNYVIVNSRLEFAEGSGDFPTDNDFRRIGLIQDPFNVGTTTISTDPTLAAFHKMTLSSVASLSVDDIIMNASSDGSGVAVGRVMSISANDVSFIQVANSEGGFALFSQTETVYVNGSSIGTVSNVNSAFPEVEKFSGQVMYIENRGAVSRAADQIEDIKLIIEM